jgi:very-short-patch-repair endonuclease
MSEEALRELAERQYATFSTRQWKEHGLGRRALDVRVARSDYAWATERVLRVVGAPRSVEQGLIILLLDAGPPTALGIGTAAALWKVPGFSLAHPRIELSLERGDNNLTVPGAILHRPRYLPAEHVTQVRGLRVTTLGRTIYDLAGRLHEDRTLAIVDRICGRSPGFLPALHSLLPVLAERGRPGIRAMRYVLDRRPLGYVFPQSGLERRFAQLLEQAGEAPLQRQVDLGGHDWIGRVDFIDWLLLLVIEVDSILHHTTPGDVARDAERDRQLRSAGFAEVIRIPEEHIWYQPHLAVAAVRNARLRARAAA